MMLCRQAQGSFPSIRFFNKRDTKTGPCCNLFSFPAAYTHTHTHTHLLPRGKTHNKVALQCHMNKINMKWSKNCFIHVAVTFPPEAHFAINWSKIMGTGNDSLALQNQFKFKESLSVCLLIFSTRVHLNNFTQRGERLPRKLRNSNLQFYSPLSAAHIRPETPRGAAVTARRIECCVLGSTLLSIVCTLYQCVSVSSPCNLGQRFN